MVVTIKLCKHGHEIIPENRNASGDCKLCRKVRDKLRSVDPTRISYMKEYRLKRGKIPRSGLATHCKRGHELTEENRIGLRRCKTCERIKHAEIERIRRRKLHPERFDSTTKMYMRHKNIGKNYNNKIARQNLDDWYVASNLGLKVREVPPEIIEIMRLNITIKRELKKCKQF